MYIYIAADKVTYKNTTVQVIQILLCNDLEYDQLIFKKYCMKIMLNALLLSRRCVVLSMHCLVDHISVDVLALSSFIDIRKTYIQYVPSGTIPILI